MDYQVISELLSQKVEGRKVLSSFFSTYSFEPDFFELEIIPLLLNIPDSKEIRNQKLFQPVLSSNDAIRWQQLQRVLKDHPLPTTVVYDPAIYQCDRSPRLEINYHPYQHLNGCQHAKIVALVCEEPNSMKQSIIFGAGSFNLTKAGWWDNIECGHFVEINAEYAPKNLCEEIIIALDFYLEKVGDEDKALHNIRAVINSLDKTSDEKSLHFFFNSGDKSKSFPEFLKKHWNAPVNLEVISPFFSLSGNNVYINTFIDNFKSTRLFLPTEQKDGQCSKIDKERYDEFNDKVLVSWHGWDKNIDNKLHSEIGNLTRDVHAKIYQIEDTNDTKLFVGSVNFSYKAFYANTEAGFLFCIPDYTPFLANNPIATPEHFVEQDGGLFGDKEEINEALPAVSLKFDWDNKKLTIVGKDIKISYIINLFNESQENIARIHPFNSDVEIVDRNKLASRLSHSSLIFATGTSNGEEMDGQYLISQSNIYKRPSSLPPMTLSDLLSIYCGMSQPELMALTERYANKVALDLGQASQTLVAETEPPKSNFFSEFSEINSAFFLLNKHLNEEDSDREKDYYLFGEQPDSLKGVVNAVKKLPAGNEATKYITLLSVLDTFQQFNNKKDSAYINDVKKQIEILESSDTFGFSDSFNVEKSDFFSWFRAEFISSNVQSTKQ